MKQGFSFFFFCQNFGLVCIWWFFFSIRHDTTRANVYIHRCLLHGLLLKIWGRYFSQLCGYSIIAYSSSSTAVIVPTEVVFEMSDLRRDEGSNTHFWLPYKGTRTDWPQRCARIKRPRPFKETQTRRISNTQNFSKWTSHQVGMYYVPKIHKCRFYNVVSNLRQIIILLWEVVLCVVCLNSKRLKSIYITTYYACDGP